VTAGALSVSGGATITGTVAVTQGSYQFTTSSTGVAAFSAVDVFGSLPAFASNVIVGRISATPSTVGNFLNLQRPSGTTVFQV
jgi:hypothetical protein